MHSIKHTQVLVSVLLIVVPVLTYGRLNSELHNKETKNLLNKKTCSSVYSCANCTAVRICSPDPDGGGLVEDIVANCTGGTPYCNPTSGTCVSEAAMNCSKKGEFICMKDGIFPHPNDCYQYFTCHNLLSYTSRCAQGYYWNYDSTTESCKYNKGCYEFDCYNKNGVKVPYQKDYSIYAFCIDGSPTVVDRCYGKDELNITSQLCEPVCHYEGLIPDTLDSTKYYQCNASPTEKGEFVMKSVKCPCGQHFDSYEFKCLNSTIMSLKYSIPSKLPVKKLSKKNNKEHQKN